MFQHSYTFHVSYERFVPMNVIYWLVLRSLYRYLSFLKSFTFWIAENITHYGIVILWQALKRIQWSDITKTTWNNLWTLVNWQFSLCFTEWKKSQPLRSIIRQIIGWRLCKTTLFTILSQLSSSLFPKYYLNSFFNWWIVKKYIKITNHTFLFTKYNQLKISCSWNLNFILNYVSFHSISNWCSMIYPISNNIYNWTSSCQFLSRLMAKILILRRILLIWKVLTTITKFMFHLIKSREWPCHCSLDIISTMQCFIVTERYRTILWESCSHFGGIKSIACFMKLQGRKEFSIVTWYFCQFQILHFSQILQLLLE